MERVARLAMKSSTAAALTAWAFLVLGLIFSPFLLLSAATITLVALRQGLSAGVKVVFYALVLYCPMYILVFNQNFSGMLFPLFLWLPIMLVAIPLRQTQDYGGSLILCGAFVFFYGCLLRLAVGDVELFWTEKMQPVLEVLSAQANLDFAKDDLSYLSSQIHIWWLILMQSCMVGTLFLARSWQSKLYYPGGFGTEFRKIQLPKKLVLVLVLIIIGTLIGKANEVRLSLSSDLLTVILVLFVVQGLAVIHHRSKSLQMSSGWLVALYIFLIFVPQITGLTLAITGIADSIADFRRLKTDSSKECEDK